MAPRAYTLKRRAETAAETRQRILNVTIELYREHGIADTTLTAIAERADVSRGTILNHFGSAEGLLGAVLDHVVETLELPDEHLFDGLEERDDRIRAFVGAMLAFMDRSVIWWSMFEDEMRRPELQEREAYYWGRLAELQVAALGPELAADPLANAVLLSIVHPATVGTFTWSFERAGLDKRQAHAVVADLAVDAIRRLEAKSHTARPRRGPRLPN